MGPADRAREQQLIRRAVALDDHAAFGDLVRQHQSPVRQFLRRLTGQDEARADDLAQETFWKAYRNLARFRGDGRFLSWLFSIAYQLFVTDQRRKQRLPSVELPPDVEGQEAVYAGGGGPRPLHGERTIERLSLDRALETLRHEERAAIDLHYRHSLTQEEVGEALKLPLGTVKSLIRRGRQKLKEAFEADSGRKPS